MSHNSSKQQRSRSGSSTAFPADFRWGLYTRVSTGPQAERGTSLETQEEMGRAKAAALGGTVARVFCDPGVSGTLYEARGELQRALLAIEGGEIGGLIFPSMDRYSRDRGHQTEILRRVEAAGGRLIFCDADYAWDDEDDEMSPEAELMFGVKGDFAAYEAKLIRKRTMRGRRARANEGRQPSRAHSPYGRHYVTHAEVTRGEFPPGSAGEVVVVEAEDAHVQEIYRLCDSDAFGGEGLSIRGICRRLEAAGVPAPSGGLVWHESVIRKILRSPLYKGELYWGRTRRRNRSAVVPAAPERHVLIPCPGTVDPERWARVQAVLDTNKRERAGDGRRRYFLSGLLRCPCCAGSCAGMMVNEGEKSFREKVASALRRGEPESSVSRLSCLYYRCHAAHKPDQAESCCTDGYHRADALEAGAVEAVRVLIRRPELVADAIAGWQAEEAARRAEALQRAPGEREKVEAELCALSDRERATIAAQIVGVLAGADPRFYAEALAEIARSRAALEERLSRLPAPINRERCPLPDRPSPARVAAEAAELLARVPEVLSDPALPAVERRALLAKFVVAIWPIAAAEGKGLPEGVAVDFRPELAGGLLEAETPRTAAPYGRWARHPDVDSSDYSAGRPTDLPGRVFGAPGRNAGPWPPALRPAAAGQLGYAAAPTGPALRVVVRPCLPFPSAPSGLDVRVVVSCPLPAMEVA